MQSKVIFSAADWGAGVLLSNIDTTSLVDGIKKKWFTIDDFADGDYTHNPVWAETGPFGGWGCAPGLGPTFTQPR